MSSPESIVERISYLLGVQTSSPRIDDNISLELGKHFAHHRHLVDEAIRLVDEAIRLFEKEIEEEETASLFREMDAAIKDAARRGL